MKTNASRACALAEDGDLRVVTAEVLDVVVDPFEGHVLVEEALVARGALVVHVEEAEYGYSIVEAHKYSLCFTDYYFWVIYF